MKLWGFLDSARTLTDVAPSGGGQNAATQSSNVAESRKRRWDGLNIVLDVNKKAKTTRSDGENSLDYSYVNWEQVKGFFRTVQGSMGAPTSSGLSEPLLTALHQYLSHTSICFRSMSEGHKATRIHFIAPVIMSVCSHFGGDMQILTDEVIWGHRVRARGHFDFVLKRGDKRICIVEAKKDDILQARTQCMVGCESLCDVEELAVAFGIATNYHQWCFVKDEAEQVTEELLTIWIESNLPNRESLRTIANKIIAIFE